MFRINYLVGALCANNFGHTVLIGFVALGCWLGVGWIIKPHPLCLPGRVCKPVGLIISTVRLTMMKPPEMVLDLYFALYYWSWAAAQHSFGIMQ